MGDASAAPAEAQGVPWGEVFRLSPGASILATGLGSGLLPKAPGTWGSFLAVLLAEGLFALHGVGAVALLAALATIPLASRLVPKPTGSSATHAHAAKGGTTTKPATHAPEPGIGLVAQLRIAARDRSYWCLHAGFFTCGFHVAFLVTHLPGEVQLCGLSAGIAATSLAIIGLANIAGSLIAGTLGGIYRMKWLLFWMYATRAVAIGIYLAAPKTAATFYVFAFVLGLTWLSTVPPTAGLVGKLFGTRYLATLFGFTLLSHQIGGFFGAWLGGLAVVNTGSYAWMWYADIVLALGAAVVNLPIREAD
mgnify:CR=1 FL=1